MTLLKTLTTIYPLTIIKDRYNGVYSGGKFTAWSLHPSMIPDDIDGGDCECMEFWDGYLEYGQYPVGKGDTPDLAVQDLEQVLIKLHGIKPSEF